MLDTITFVFLLLWSLTKKQESIFALSCDISGSLLSSASVPETLESRGPAPTRQLLLEGMTGSEHSTKDGGWSMKARL